MQGFLCMVVSVSDGRQGWLERVMVGACLTQGVCGLVLEGVLGVGASC